MNDAVSVWFLTGCGVFCAVRFASNWTKMALGCLVAAVLLMTIHNLDTFGSLLVSPTGEIAAGPEPDAMELCAMSCFAMGATLALPIALLRMAGSKFDEWMLATGDVL